MTVSSQHPLRLIVSRTGLSGILAHALALSAFGVCELAPTAHPPGQEVMPPEYGFSTVTSNTADSLGKDPSCFDATFQADFWFQGQ